MASAERSEAPSSAAEARPPRSLVATNVVASGFYFGLLQWSVFLTLQTYVASTALVYLLASTAWLAGGALGLALGRSDREPLWILASLASWFAILGLTKIDSYDLRLLPMLLVATAGMGAYAGRFFRYRATSFERPKWLFFLENTGFVAGIAATVPALLWLGRSFFVAGPLATGLVVWVTALAVGRYAGKST